MRTQIAVILLSLGPVSGIAQSVENSADCAVSNSAASTEPLVTDEQLVSVLQVARQCLERVDTACAERAIAELNPAEMGPNARGALQLVLGDIGAVDSAFTSAESEYREALASPATHIEIRRAAATRLAILYLRQADYQGLLRHVAALGCDERSAELSYLEASAHFESGDYDNALTKIDLAIGALSADGSAAPESWRSVRDATLQALAGDHLYCETETPLGSNIPVEQCYTREELRQLSACQQTARSQRTVNQTIECRPR